MTDVEKELSMEINEIADVFSESDIDIKPNEFIDFINESIGEEKIIKYLPTLDLPEDSIFPLYEIFILTKSDLIFDFEVLLKGFIKKKVEFRYSVHILKNIRAIVREWFDKHHFIYTFSGESEPYFFIGGGLVENGPATKFVNIIQSKLGGAINARKTK